MNRTRACLGVAVLCALAARAEEKNGSVPWSNKPFQDTAQQAELRRALAGQGRIAFQASYGNKDNPDIWCVNADGSNLMRLTSSVFAEEQPSWSPDGKYIAFVRSRQKKLQRHTPGDLLVVNSDGTGNERKLVENIDCFGGCSFHPSGEAIIYFRKKGGMHLMCCELQTGKETHWSADKRIAEAFAPAFSGDGAALVFSITPHWRGALISIDTGKLQAASEWKILASPGEAACNWEISPDGKRAAWVNDRGKCSVISVGQLEGGKVTHLNQLNLGPPAAYYCPTFSPDGRYLAYVVGHGEESPWLKRAYDVMVADLATMTSIPVVNSGARCYHPTWTRK